MPTLEQLWDELDRQPIHRFEDWPNRDVTKGKPGVYLIYLGKELKYVGMASANMYGRLNQLARVNGVGISFVCMWGIVWSCPS